MHKQDGLIQFLNWFREYIKVAYKASSIDFGDIIKQAIPPDLDSIPDDDSFKKLIKNNDLTVESVFLLIYSLAPIYMQRLMDGMMLAKETMNSSTSSPGLRFICTVENALNLMADNDVIKRTHYLSLLFHESPLKGSNLINLIESTPQIHISSNIIAPSDKTMELIVSGEESKFSASSDFSAHILKTDKTWKDLILEDGIKERLHEIEEWVKFEAMLEDSSLDFSNFRKGYKALFYGPPGTGKTLAASLIGKLTGKQVYKIDLSAMVSKYIGETEKNLRKIFDKADHGKWVLFFDEADSLFGKRGQTKSSNDRYANQEVSYLLQRFESYEGIAILASNLKENIDVAFSRRFDNVVNFRIPEPEEREQLWRIHLPGGMKFADDINLTDVARSVKITGAGIHNVLRRACMKAVLRGSIAVEGKDILESIKLEFAKENKML